MSYDYDSDTLDAIVSEVDDLDGISRDELERELSTRGGIIGPSLSRDQAVGAVSKLIDDDRLKLMSDGRVVVQDGVRGVPRPEFEALERRVDALSRKLDRVVESAEGGTEVEDDVGWSGADKYDKHAISNLEPGEYKWNVLTKLFADAGIKDKKKRRERSDDIVKNHPDFTANRFTFEYTPDQ